MNSVRSIHQLVVSAKPGDAVFNHAQLLRTWLREWGYASEIYAEGLSEDLPRGEAQPWSRVQAEKARDSLLIFHYSTGSPLTADVRKMTMPVILMYHNVTPSEYFRGVHQQLYEQTLRGREELPDLRDVALALANSDYSEEELCRAGFGHTGVLPLPIDEERYAIQADESVMRSYADDRTNILFVGRVAPNKRHEDLLRAFYYYKRLDPGSRLLLVGNWQLCERYKAWLDSCANARGLADVHFCGHVSTAELVAYYRVASLFLCMSEHEGLCVPLLESMHFGVPVLAYASTAIPSTLGEAGVQIHRKDFPVVAETMHVLVRDDLLRARVIARQRQRLQAFRPETVKPAFRSYLDSVLATSLR
ncbi:MAG: glycosyltransferase [Dehalococcoidales bacterium]|nr:glycosyltransferase [Dehalococcoidales bacterium]